MGTRLLMCCSGFTAEVMKRTADAGEEENTAGLDNIIIEFVCDIICIVFNKT